MFQDLEQQHSRVSQADEPHIQAARFLQFECCLSDFLQATLIPFS